MIKKAKLNKPGHDALWLWFGLSRASFLTLPRALMHEMPDKWQLEMTKLLMEFNEEYSNIPDIDFSVVATENGRFVKMPEVFVNYRHPDKYAISAMKTMRRKARK